MRRKFNVPTEVLRSVIAIAEKGSLTKAAAYLNLSQPAMSAQIKRIETMVGGLVFVKSPNGSRLTELGKLVVVHAKKILSANEQLLAIGGSGQQASTLRVGLSSLLVRRFVQRAVSAGVTDFQIQSNHSSKIIDELLSRRVDIGCLFHVGAVPNELAGFVAKQTEEELSWVRSQSFVLSPGTLLPIVSWTVDEWMTDALRAGGVPYRIVFNGQDYDAKRAAVESGLGVSVLPTQLIAAPLIAAKEYYLPKLPPVKLLICVQPHIDPKRISKFLEILSRLFADEHSLAA